MQLDGTPTARVRTESSSARGRAFSRPELLTAAGGPRLGHIAKFTTASATRSCDSRAERYVLQSVAQSMLCSGGVPDADGGWLRRPEWYRLAGCHRCRARQEDGSQRNVELYYNAEAGKAYYGGLQTCGSPWVCPVCNGVIYDYRRQEIAYALRRWRDELERPCLFITFTARHRRSTKLSAFLPRLAKALSLVYTGGAFTRLKRRTEYEGSIRGLEVTYSEVNGWHPHFHVLWFCRSWAGVDELELYVRERWHEALREVGLSGVRGVEVVVKRQWTTAEYMAKFERERCWDLDAELSFTQRKRGTHEWHWSPFDLLRQAAACGVGSSAWSRWSQLFREYAGATKGKSSLRWSRGLRAALGMCTDITDEAIAAGAVQHGYPTLAWLEARAWLVVCANDARYELLQAASGGEFAEVDAFLASLGCPAGSYHAVEPVAPDVPDYELFLTGGRPWSEVFPPAWDYQRKKPSIPDWVSRDARRSARRRAALLDAS